VKTDRLFLEHMLEAVERIREFVDRISVEDFSKDWVLQDALVRRLEILGEAAGRVSREFADAHAEIPWRAITGLRHKLIHDYFEVDLSVVWETATHNVPELEPLLREILNEFGEAPGG
jgi:uncharacterized protein with HEPN domain